MADSSTEFPLALPAPKPTPSCTQCPQGHLFSQPSVAIAPGPAPREAQSARTPFGAATGAAGATQGDGPTRSEHPRELPEGMKSFSLWSTCGCSGRQL